MATKILVPSLGESVSEGIVAAWLKQPGDEVAADEVVMELETDKVTIEVLAPEAGILASHEVGEGDTVEPGATLGLIGEGAAAPAAQPEPVATPEPEAVAEAAPASENLSPAVEKLTAENPEIDTASIDGSGKDGRLTKGDMLAAGAVTAGTAAAATSAVTAAPASPSSAQAPQAAAAPAEPIAKQSGASDKEKRVRMSGLRRTIARRLKEAQNTAAILTTYNEADMTAIKALRAQHQDVFVKKHGTKLGFMSFFVAACCQALKDIPAVNAEIDGDELIYKNYYNIGVAVGTPTGLVVPVIKDADAMGFADIENAITDFGTRARDGKITMDDMSGGTFTVSNGGVYGSLMSAPILNPPQSGILGMHKIQDRPMAINGQVEIRPMMYLALSYDHRIIDGKEAVTFLVKVKEALENPERLMLGI